MMARAEDPDTHADTRIVYLAPKDVLVARVARKCMMHLCEALSMLGADVELISMRIRTAESEPTRTRSIWDVYGIEHRFRVTMIPTPLRQERMDWRLSRHISQFLRIFVYPIYACLALLRPASNGSRPKRTVFYSRNYACALGVLPLRKLLHNRARIILEIHLPPRGRLQHKLLEHVDGVACQSHALQRLLVDNRVLEEGRSVGRHGGWSPQLTECARVSREDARQRLGWAPTDRVACYTGKVVWGLEEIKLLVSMAEQLRDDRVRVVIVGGRADHVALWRAEVANRGFDNVQLPGFVAPADALLYQMAADVLLLYYPSGIPLNDFRSPGKLFEYMASGTPAVVADYLSIREVIRDGENGLLVPPDRPDLLAEAVRRVLNDQELAARLAGQARTDAMSFTWTATASATLSLVDRLWNPST